MAPVDAPDRSASAADLSRRAFLRRSGLVAGGIGVAAVAAGCVQAGAAQWSYVPQASTAPGVPSPSAASAAPASPAAPSAAASASQASAAPASASPASPVPSPSPSPSSTARDPSPADFAVPPAYRPALSTPVTFDLTSHDGPGEVITINTNPVVAYQSMNFDHQVPAPTLRVTEGDTVRFTLTNGGQMAHSIDFHAAQLAWSKHYQDVAPGASETFDWTAKHAGVFMYHCGTAPVLMHIADGMYGAVVVDPKGGRPRAREYLLVQSEFYGTGGDYTKMLTGQPDIVAFNGQALRYKTNPLVATAGELVRIFIVNAGPSSFSAFHVIGALFSHYEAEGNPANAQGMHQTIDVPPGDGALVELTFAEPGMYPFVTHSFVDAAKGAVGMFDVR